MANGQKNSKMHRFLGAANGRRKIRSFGKHDGKVEVIRGIIEISFVWFFAKNSLYTKDFFILLRNTPARCWE